MLKLKLDTQETGHSNKEPLYAILETLHFKIILVVLDVPI